MKISEPLAIDILTVLRATKSVCEALALGQGLSYNPLDMIRGAEQASVLIARLEILMEETREDNI